MSAVAGLRTLGLISCVCIAASLLPACGDDDDNSATDAGSDAGPDSGMTTPPPTRRDAGMTPSSSDPVPPCDRSDPSSCGPGEYCDLVIRRYAGDTDFGVYSGCVQQRRVRGAGDPCDPDPTAGDPYSVPGLTDEVYTDSCGPDLICAPDVKVRGAATCQPYCFPGSNTAAPIACKSATAICLSANDYISFCRESEGCDLAQQTGCRAGSQCVLIPSDDSQQLLAACLPQRAMATADGQTCTSFSECNPGSVCFSPVRLPLARWSDQPNDIKCRKVCTGPSDSDAGDDDAGVVSCPPGTHCAAYSESGLGLGSIPKAPYGQCE